ncbi:tyrosine-specific transport protein [Candidatus Protochlamydia naegleriophila]|uniref:Tyrosine-specific transport protein n=1 Tax=Candidatus Protochlamydia naegleriophila TaxID=389348 RepID=A0A0U5J7X3_9BACT|nr:aromatic amino acid transport family protein [Candidatus Protochlamydia naegleriophila]CUI16185.1 tyrosine-specific transport protein [Candidatus Protochlamydia naegleriophila]
MEHQKGSILGGSLLVAGTSIGGGMLALPVLTSLAGFMPSLVIYLLCWLFMASTGLLFLEISQWIKGESNIITMAETTLGKTGRYFAWAVYLFLFYCLTVAYMVGCGNIVVELFQHRIPDWLGPILFVIVFAPLILIPTAWAGRLNVWLVAGLALSYLGFVLLGFRYVDLDLLRNYNWSYSLMVLPIAFTSFAYQGIIPTLASYMHHDAPSIRKAILIGSFIPLIAYVIWEGLILGIVPTEGAGGLAEALKNGNNAVYPLKNFIQSPAVYYVGQSFAFFALVTSFLGVTLGLRDFLADGLKIHKDAKGKIILALLIFTIPLMISVSYPHIFLIALDYAGGFGVALLLGLLPIVMTWVGRYHFKWMDQPQLPGGKVVLILLALFVFFELFNETKHLLERAFA